MAFTHGYSMVVISLLAMLIMDNIQPIMSQPEQTQALIDKICRSNEDFGFCIKTFNDNLKDPATDIAGLTRITIDQCLSNSSNTLGFIGQLLSNTTDEPTKNALVACQNAYQVVLKSYQDASVEFDSKDYEDMRKSESVTPRAQASCETSFSTPPNPADLLVERNRQMRILITMAVATGIELGSPSP